MAEHGGSRPGAGRKKKDRTPDGTFATAQDYLEAVVKGLIAPDSVRVAAAKVLIQYEKAKQRAPVKNLPPERLRQKTEKDVEKSINEDFEKQAAIIREKFRNKMELSNDNDQHRADA